MCVRRGDPRVHPGADPRKLLPRFVRWQGELQTAIAASKKHANNWKVAEVQRVSCGFRMVPYLGRWHCGLAKYEALKFPSLRNEATNMLSQTNINKANCQRSSHPTATASALGHTHDTYPSLQVLVQGFGRGSEVGEVDECEKVSII